MTTSALVRRSDGSVSASVSYVSHGISRAGSLRKATTGSLRGGAYSMMAALLAPRVEASTSERRRRRLALSLTLSRKAGEGKGNPGVRSGRVELPQS